LNKIENYLNRLELLYKMAYQNILVFDTETTGLPNRKSVELTDQPHIVQFSYLIYHMPTQTITKIVDRIVKIPLEIELSEFCKNIHKIDQIICQEYGVEIEKVLEEFYEDLLICDLCVAHNIQFDLFMVKTECKRMLTKQEENFLEYQKIKRRLRYLKNCGKFYCTMMNSIQLCKITFPNSLKYKFPKLSELHTHLFGELNENIVLHNALFDVYVCLRCYIKIKEDNDLPTSLLKELYFL